jgi:L-threonylcarbamoyladenylate synthase
MNLRPPSAATFNRVAELLRRGCLVAFPTETVYGLGADARNPAALARVFRAKGRPADHPLIVHLGSVDDIEQWACDIPDEAWKLAEHFWPGPLTLILNRGSDVPELVTGGQNTVGLRTPAHPVALELLKTFGGGIAAPSANRFGRVSPTTAAHVIAELGDAVDCIIDGGACAVGLESTILDLSGASARLLRPGAVTADALARILGKAPNVGATADAPRVSGSLPSHYAPDTPLRLLEATEIESTVRSLLAEGTSVVVLSMKQPPTAEPRACRWLPMPADAAAYAQILYARLRKADALDCDRILVERPPAAAEWIAVLNRLGRAAARPHR